VEFGKAGLRKMAARADWDTVVIFPYRTSSDLLLKIVVCD